MTEMVFNFKLEGVDLPSPLSVLPPAGMCQYHLLAAPSRRKAQLSPLCLPLRSVCLLLQVSLPCVLFAASPSQLRLRGGTNAEMAPQIDYTTMVRAFEAADTPR